MVKKTVYSPCSLAKEVALMDRSMAFSKGH